MLHGDQVAVYLLTAFIVGGITFLLWALAHLFFESRRQRRERTQAVPHYRPRL